MPGPVRRTNPAPVPVEPPASISPWRDRVVLLIFIGAFALLWWHFFDLQVLGRRQYLVMSAIDSITDTEHGSRGQIYSSDGYLLAGNRHSYELYCNVPALQITPGEFYDTLAPLITADREASSSLKPRAEFIAGVVRRQEEYEATGSIRLATHVSVATMLEAEKLGLGRALQADSVPGRYYPENEATARFLGHYLPNERHGNAGIEGGFDDQLQGTTTTTIKSLSALNAGMTLGGELSPADLDGRDLYLTINRRLQVLADQALKEGAARFGAEAGEIIITEPKTGRILAMAATPSYQPSRFYNYNYELYKNPSLENLYEPGSTFKVLTVAAGIDAGVMNENTICPNCGSDRFVDGYRIHNWNDSHHPNITMKEALAESDNIAMSYIALNLLGKQKFADYLHRFKINEKVDLQVKEEAGSFPTTWSDIELANRSFGQGVSISSLQLVRAVGAIANHGQMMKLHLVDKVFDHATKEEIAYPAAVEATPISRDTADRVAVLMQNSAAHGDAKFLYSDADTLIAGKTGTAQIPRAGGGYEDSGTIASFIGFAPYNDPQFLMLVKYVKPQTSTYGSETAAVTWKELAEELFAIFGIEGS